MNQARVFFIDKKEKNGYTLQQSRRRWIMVAAALQNTRHQKIERISEEQQQRLRSMYSLKCFLNAQEAHKDPDLQHHSTVVLRVFTAQPSEIEFQQIQVYAEFIVQDHRIHNIIVLHKNVLGHWEAEVCCPANNRPSSWFFAPTLPELISRVEGPIAFAQAPWSAWKKKYKHIFKE